MDVDTREAFKEVREAIQGLSRDIQGVLSEMHNNQRTLDRELASTGELARSAYVRIKDQNDRLDGHLSEHRDRRKWWLGLGAGVIVAVVSYIWRWVTGEK